MVLHSVFIYNIDVTSTIHVMQLIFPSPPASRIDVNNKDVNHLPIITRTLFVMPKDFPLKDTVMHHVHAAMSSTYYHGGGEAAVEEEEEGQGCNNTTLWIKNEASRHVSQTSSTTTGLRRKDATLQWSYFSTDGEVVGDAWSKRSQSAEQVEETLEKVSIKYVENAESLRWVLANVHLFHPPPRVLVIDDFSDLCNLKPNVSPMEMLALANEYLTSISVKTSRPSCLITIVTNNAASTSSSSSSSSTPPRMSTTKLRWAFDSRIDFTKINDNRMFAAKVDHSGNETAGAIEKVLLKVVG